MTWPENLVSDLARRRSVIFLGAGVSRNSLGLDGKTRPPLWPGFLETCLAKLTTSRKYVKSLIRGGDLLTAAEILQTNLDDKWSNLLTDTFVTPKFQPAAIHDHVYRLDARICLTQNIDKIYDTYAQHQSKNTILVKRHFDSDVATAIRGDARCIIKAHGTIDQPAKMIFTRSEYARARFEHMAFYSAMDALALTHTFLFVGAGLADPDVQMLFERSTQMHPHARPHYMMASRGSVHKDHVASLKRNMNLRIIEYAPSISHHHLSTLLSDLVKEVDAKRQEFSQTLDW